MNRHTIPDSLIGSEVRLAALAAYGILDTPSEPAFDGIVRLATRLCLDPSRLGELRLGGPPVVQGADQLPARGLFFPKPYRREAVTAVMHRLVSQAHH